MSPLLLPLVICLVIILVLLWRLSTLANQVEQSKVAIDNLVHINETLEAVNSDLRARNSFLEPVRKLAHPHDVRHYAENRRSHG